MTIGLGAARRGTTMTGRRGARPLASLLASTILGWSLASPASEVWAQQPQAIDQHAIRFQIPAQPLASAIDAFIDQSGWQISYSTAVARDKTSSAVAGEMTPAEALRRLVSGTGLAVRLTGADAAALFDPLPQGDDQKTGALTLDTLTVEGAGIDPGVGLGGGVVTRGYVAEAARIGTKTDTDLKKVPQSIAVVSRQELEDRDAQSLVEAVGYSSGVRTGVYGFDPRFDTIHVRGFNVSSEGFYRDGLRDLGGSFSVFRKEPYGFEAVSVLKGPSSTLYGGGSPGGIIDVVSKRPTEQAFNEIEIQAGTRDHRQINLDTSGPVLENDTVLYRLTGLYREADTQYLAAPNDRFYVAPAVTLRSDDRDTHLTLLTEYTDLTTGGAAGYYTSPDLKTRIETGDPAWGDFDQMQWRVGYEFEHRFNDVLALRQNMRYSNIKADMRWTGINDISDDGATATRSTGRIRDEAWTIGVDTHAQADFATGPLSHTVLGGVDVSYIDSDYKYGAGTAPDLNLITGNYGQQAIEGPATLDLIRNTVRQRQTGLYLQDQIEIDRVVLTFGGRYDWLRSQAKNRLDLSSSTEHYDDNFSYRVGLTYLFDNGISPYVSYATSFAPTTGTSASGAAFEPTTGEQVEVGVKYIPDSLPLSINAALFKIRQENVLASDPDNVYFQIQRGEVESTGFEIQATTRPIDGLDLTASYTYLDMEIAAGDNAGKIPSGIPHHQITAWANYVFQSGLAKGLTLGAGSRFYGESWGNDTNTVKNDARVLVDAAIGYDFSALSPQLRGVSAQINGKNLFDNRAVTFASNLSYREEGREVVGSLRYRF